MSLPLPSAPTGNKLHLRPYVALSSLYPYLQVPTLTSRLITLYHHQPSSTMSLSKSTDITGSSRSKSFSTPAHSPQLITPNNTPPHSSFAEQRLQQLLMNCEAGTHSFHRDDGDDYTPRGSVPGPVAAVAGDMRRKSFAGGEGMFLPLFHASTS